MISKKKKEKFLKIIQANNKIINLIYIFLEKNLL